MSIRKADAKSLKPGSYLMIDDEPCKVLSVETSKPGKHGAAKARVVAVGFFTGRKRDVIMPADRMVDVPVIEKRSATVIADLGDHYQVMDTESYETYDIPKPDDPEILGKVQLNSEVEVWEIMGRRTITRVK
ncbi:MAG: translation initiation factor IF-5A [Candidatus Thorarchaeota archaeon]